jgi:hypothetical protein
VLLATICQTAGTGFSLVASADMLEASAHVLAVQADGRAEQKLLKKPKSTAKHAK